jgi:hypothetical protein
MPLLTELIAYTLGNYKDLAPTEPVIGSAETKNRVMLVNGKDTKRHRVHL